MVQSPVGSLLSPGSWYAQDLVSDFQEWSLCFPYSGGGPVVKSRWPSKSDSLGIPNLFARSWGWEAWDAWGSEPSQQWRNFFGIIVLQFVGRPASRRGIWLYLVCTPPTIPLWLLFYLWTHDIFFGGFQCPPVSSCPTANCYFGLLTGGDEHMSIYSAILNQSPVCITDLFFLMLSFKSAF